MVFHQPAKAQVVTAFCLLVYMIALLEKLDYHFPSVA